MNDPAALFASSQRKVGDTSRSRGREYGFGLDLKLEELQAKGAVIIVKDEYWRSVPWKEHAVLVAQHECLCNEDLVLSEDGYWCVVGCGVIGRWDGR